MVERHTRALDIVTVVMNGQIGMPPIKGKSRSELKFKIDGYDVMGVALAIVVALDVLLRQCTIVTVCGHDGGGGGSPTTILIILTR